MSNLHDICKEYNLCCPETRAKLEKNGFDFSICKFGITTTFTDNIVIRTQHESDQIYEAMEVVPYPLLEEVLKLLPIGNDNISYLGVTRNTLVYHDVYNEKNYMVICGNENLCEAACQLWIKLKEGGFLNG